MKPLLAAFLAASLVAMVSASADARSSSTSVGHGARAAKPAGVVTRKTGSHVRGCRGRCRTQGRFGDSGPGFGGDEQSDSLPPGCEMRREQISDLYGWRVRDVMHCEPQ